MPYQYILRNVYMVTYLDDGQPFVQRFWIRSQKGDNFTPDDIYARTDRRRPITITHFSLRLR